MNAHSQLTSREKAREKQFSAYWKHGLNDVFADVAPYYDSANRVASLGLWRWFLSSFISMINVRPGERVLDVCAGTNAIGIALLQHEPSLEMHAMDRSAAMQNVGSAVACARGLRIQSLIGDVHKLPFPDNYFDVATLQFASRHLRVKTVFAEIHRVLKPGGRFCHCDMLRPNNKVVEKIYYGYLRICLFFTGFLFRSGPAAMSSKRYFLDVLKMFYRADELSGILREIGYRDVSAKCLLGGMIGMHHATKSV